MLSYNRFEIMPDVLQHNCDTAGYPFDLHVWDNNSSDNDIQDFFNQMYERGDLNSITYCTENVGIAKAFNSMLSKLGDQYDAFVFMGNDIKEPPMWLYDRVKYLEAFPMSGMISISPHAVRPDYPELMLSGMPFYAGDVIGQFMISKQVLDRVGSLIEYFGKYGPIDNDYNLRCSIAGFVNYYIPGKAFHIDESTPTDYGYNKQECIAETWPIHVKSISNYNACNIYLPLPGDLTINMKDHV